MSIRLFYGMWPQYDRRLREVIGAMTDEQLAIRPSPEGWPIWATVGHTAGGRVYWLCTVLGEPGAEETPFAGGDDRLGGRPRPPAQRRRARDGPRDDLADHRPLPRQLDARDARGPDRAEIRRAAPGPHPCVDVQRLFSHEAYHCGELSQTLGIAGLPQIDLWRPD